MSTVEPDFKGTRLLVVEDDDDLREIVADIFRMVGAEVVEAPNGRLAFELFKQGVFQAVVSDVRMPEEDGLALLANIRAIDPVRPPFVFLTGHSDVTAPQAVARGAQLTIGKPFDTLALLVAVRTLIDTAPT